MHKTTLRSLLAATLMIFGYGEVLAVDYSIIDLGSLGGSTTSTRPADINNSGYVTGYSQTSDGKAYSFIWNPETRSMTTPGPIGAGYTTDSTWNWGYSINNSGTIAGYNKNYGLDAAFTYSAENGVTTIPIRKDGIGGYYWQDGRAYDINDSGVVVGVVKNGGYYNTSFIYNPDGTFTTFKKPEMGMTEAMAINNSGVIAGYSWTNYEMVKAWIYQDGAFTELGALGTFADTWLPTYASDINESNMVTGTSQRWYDPTPDYEYDYKPRGLGSDQANQPKYLQI